MIVQALMVALSGVGLFTWRWLHTQPQVYRAALPVPEVIDLGPITTDSDYRGLVL